MTFSESVKTELSGKECAWDCCARAELATALLLSGGVAFRGRGKYGLSISTEHMAAAKYYFGTIRHFFGVVCEIRTLKTTRLGEHTRYLLTFPDDSVDRMLDELKLRDENGLFGITSAPHPEIFEKNCCAHALLKSAFLTSGTLSSPERGYDFSITAGNEEIASAIEGVMKRFDLNAGVSKRKAQFAVYLKNAEDISEMLTRIGAHAALLSFENTRILKELRNNVNRLANCDSSNIDRTVKTAQTQIEDIEFIDQHLGIEKLPPPIREIANLRLMEPNASLAELGEMCSPPIGKSGVNNRIRRLTEIARTLREGKP